MEKKATLTVNMHCEGCATRISSILGEVRGIRDVRANLSDKKLVLWFDDDEVTLPTVKKKIEEIGYSVE